MAAVAHKTTPAARRVQEQRIRDLTVVPAQVEQTQIMPVAVAVGRVRSGLMLPTQLVATAAQVLPRQSQDLALPAQVVVAVPLLIQAQQRVQAQAAGATAEAVSQSQREPLTQAAAAAVQMAESRQVRAVQE